MGKRPAGLTPKVATIIPGGPISLEGMPTDELLAGVVCLSSALASSLRDVVTHVVRNMEDKALNT